MQFILVKNKKRIAVGAVALLFAIIAFSFMSVDKIPTSQKDFPIDIPNAGGIIPLQDAMAQNRELRRNVEKLLSYDVAYLFVNYRQVNAETAQILFLWAGLSPQEVREIGGAQAIDEFIRAYHGVPDDVMISNNPLLGPRPWPRIFNIMKARLLMMGQGHQIYEGVAYYNSLNDSFDIQGNLSTSFVNGFREFLKQQPAGDRPRFRNNFLSFVDTTKGLNNLSEADKDFIKTLND